METKKTWIIADTHFNHDNIIICEKRPFNSKEEMNETIIKLWNETVAPYDIVYHLGNVIFGDKMIKDGILKQLNGYKILRLGNLDKRTIMNQWKQYFDEVYEDDILLDDLCLSHLPLSKYEMDRLLALGLIKGNVHGHLHSQKSNLEQTKYKCVSAKLTNFRPIAFEEVKKYFGIGMN
ncbi:hypothetical protein [Bacillus chungangensis]|uniref:Calcineurin-like phosphoesterase family protein n=1 Tax=Bacillus chungangensis TaxID=587633 RepID=A0ABT9WYT3_9BACI|nr:hypothetical protein [Bacillus chungangensis]MDQ0178464.1 calcineurin-like phosphoesterase family protein [Bacillus chungangensis]